ncbi:unnamed protein product [Acidithrix sp. C25]|nr:unnamed protein product [Acidithrix sp. C25]
MYARAIGCARSVVDRRDIDAQSIASFLIDSQLLSSAQIATLF